MVRAIGTIGLGAALMYVMDLSSGRRRRAMLRDRVVGLLHDVEDGIGKGARDVGNRLAGAVSGMRHLLAPAAPVDDDVLVARIRSRLGRLVSHPHAIEVAAGNGEVLLGGVILAHEVPGLLAGLSHVPGVVSITNELETHEHAAHVPGLQGAGRRDAAMAGAWTPAMRLLAGLVGLRVARRGLRRGGVFGTLFGLGGLGLLYRAFSNRPMGTAAGQGVTFHKSMTIQATPAEVYALWSNPENFPRFMAHLVEVRRLDDRRHHWVARGPAGVPAAWDSEIIGLEPERLVAWRSVPGSMVENAGCVRFAKADGATRIDIELRYHPPAGALGHLVAALFGTDPKHAMDEDLVRLKSLLEDGKTRVAGHTVTRSDIGIAAGETATTRGQEAHRE
jgi:uncharacterized membrane protein